jgi:Zn-dependent peptidase ImmA (M78 family)
MTSSTLEPAHISASPSVYGARLRDARLLRGLKGTEASRMIGLSPVQLSRLEKASTSTPVDPQLLARISDLYGFEDGFFVNPPGENLANSGLLFRAKRSLAAFDEEAIGTWARVVSELMEATYEWLKPIPVSVPTYAADLSPHQAADETRRLLGISEDAPVGHVVRTLEKMGIAVAKAPFDSNGSARHDAVSLWTGARLDRPVILLREIDSWERIRMSAAHELGHLILHRWSVSEDAEDDAFAFAAAFLMPARGFRADWPIRPTLTNLLPLKRKWGVSLAALIERAFRMGLLPANERTALITSRLEDGKNLAGCGTRCK